MSMNASPVLILTGPPGVGKTTVAAMLADRAPRAVHLESDVFFGFLRTGYVEPWKRESHGQNHVVMGIVGEAAASYARAGYFTVIDGIVIPRWFLIPLRDTLNAAGFPVAYVVLRAPQQVCAERVAAREGQAAPDRVALEGIWEQFADLGRYEEHAIDVAQATPAEVAETIGAALQGGAYLV